MPETGSQDTQVRARLDFIDAPINPTTPRLFTVITTFAGCGGSSLGYKWAGGKVLAAVEWDDNAVETYRLNHLGTPVLHRDIATVTAEELLELTGLKVGELDIFEGSPPCQGFSTAGKRQLDDPRNSLFKEYVRLLRGLRPKVFIMENVSGMVKGTMKHVFAIAMRELKASGYKVKCQLMNAMYFGVPQSRQRVIFIGVRDDLGIESSHPQPVTILPISVREAIGLDGAVEYRSSYKVGTVSIHQTAFDKPSPTLMKVESPMMRHYVVGDRITDVSIDGPAPPLSDKYKRYWNIAKQGDTVGKLSISKKLTVNLPSHALVKSGGYGDAYHPLECRALSTGERKRLASFPDAFKFTSWQTAIERIGNSVPPRFMQAIAEHVYQHILLPSHSNTKM